MSGGGKKLVMSHTGGSVRSTGKVLGEIGNHSSVGAGSTSTSTSGNGNGVGVGVGAGVGVGGGGMGGKSGMKVPLGWGDSTSQAIPLTFSNDISTTTIMGGVVGVGGGVGGGGGFRPRTSADILNTSSTTRG